MKAKQIIVMLLVAISFSSCGVYYEPGVYREHVYYNRYHGGYYHGNGGYHGGYHGGGHYGGGRR